MLPTEFGQERNKKSTFSSRLEAAGYFWSPRLPGKMVLVVMRSRKGGGGGGGHSQISARLRKDLLPQARGFPGTQSKLSIQPDV